VLSGSSTPVIACTLESGGAALGQAIVIGNDRTLL
jgi:hypothetical protein